MQFFCLFSVEEVWMELSDGKGTLFHEIVPQIYNFSIANQLCSGVLFDTLLVYFKV
jgi:hypothetical protein